MYPEFIDESLTPEGLVFSESDNPHPPPGTNVFSQETAKDILVDIDDNVSMSRFVTLLPRIDDAYGVYKIRIWPSRSKGAHAHIRLHNMVQSHEETYLIQAILGSDPLKELISLIRIRKHNWISRMISGKKLMRRNLLFKPAARWKYREPTEAELDARITKTVKVANRRMIKL